MHALRDGGGGGHRSPRSPRGHRPSHDDEEDDAIRKLRREIQRLEAMSRAKLMQVFVEAYDGAPVIRALEKQQSQKEHLREAADKYATCHFNLCTVQRWLGFALELHHG